MFWRYPLSIKGVKFLVFLFTFSKSHPWFRVVINPLEYLFNWNCFSLESIHNCLIYLCNFKIYVYCCYFLCNKPKVLIPSYWFWNKVYFIFHGYGYSWFLWKTDTLITSLYFLPFYISQKLISHIKYFLTVNKITPWKCFK